MAECIDVEKCSYNDGYQSPDVTDKCPANDCCCENGSDTLETGLNVEKLCERANNYCKTNHLTASCQPSTDPGRYLCAYTYYKSLSIDKSKSLFVHVPAKEVFAIQDMSHALKEIIFDSLNQLYNSKF